MIALSDSTAAAIASPSWSSRLRKVCNSSMLTRLILRHDAPRKFKASDWPPRCSPGCPFLSSILFRNLWLTSILFVRRMTRAESMDELSVSCRSPRCLMSAASDFPHVEVSVVLLECGGRSFAEVQPQVGEVHAADGPSPPASRTRRSNPGDRLGSGLAPPRKRWAGRCRSRRFPNRCLSGCAAARVSA